MGKASKDVRPLHGMSRSQLGLMVHEAVRRAIEQAVEEELAQVLSARRYERGGQRRGHRNGHRQRTLSGPTGPLALRVPRGLLTTENGVREWSSGIVPRYQRRLPEINEAIIGVYLAGNNTRRIKGALKPLLRETPLSKSAVSRVVTTLKADFEAWRQRPLGELEVVYLFLDAIVLKVRRDGRVQGAPVLCAVAVLADGSKRLVGLELCAGESRAAWEGFVQGLDQRGLRAPVLCVIDGNPGLRSALGQLWSKTRVQRCAVHKLRNLQRKAPKASYDEVRADYHDIVYAASRAEADKAMAAFVRKWTPRCKAVVDSLQEAGEELLTFYAFPASQWKTLRTTNLIERMNGEMRRRTKTQSSYPNDTTAEVLLFSLVATGQIVMRKIVGHADLWRVLLMPKAKAA